MKKIYIGGYGACSVHTEKQLLEYIIESLDNIEQINEYKDADLIVLTEMCIGTYSQFENSLKTIKYILDQKKETTPVIVSGCLSKGVKFSLTTEQKDILSRTTLIKPNELLEFVIKKINAEMSEEMLEDIKMPYRVTPQNIITSIVEGCLNKCSFCKSNYMNFDLRSIPMETIKRFKEEMDLESENNLYLNLISSNISQYGIDLYSKKRAHEAIHLLTSSKNIRWANVGALINFYPELVKEIIENEKIKKIFTSLESGSQRVYELMNRPISLEKLIETIKTIKQERPDIIIETEIICGFPTETIDDFRKSLSLIEELDVMPIFLHPYDDSLQIPSHNLPQKSYEYNYYLMLYGQEKLKKIQSKFNDEIERREQVVILRSDKYRCYRTMLINGDLRNVSYNQLDKVYEPGEIISPDVVKPKQLVKRGV